MIRPCFLVLDREYAGSISSRKLVIETAKFNVITAYSSDEAIGTLKKYPNLDGVVLDADTKDMPCDDLIRSLKAVRAGIPIVVVVGLSAKPCDGADHYIDSFAPGRLLFLLQSLQPVLAAEIKEKDAELSAQ